MDKQKTLELVKRKLFIAEETRKNPKYLELYLNDTCAFISYEIPTRLLCIEFLIKIGDTERAERHILDTDNSECKAELTILRTMLMSKKGCRKDGHLLLDTIDSDELNAEAFRLYISALEEYGEFEKAFQKLSDKIKKYENDEFLLIMLVRLYDENIIKAELFNERDKADSLKAEKEIYLKQLEKLGIKANEK